MYNKKCISCTNCKIFHKQAENIKYSITNYFKKDLKKPLVFHPWLFLYLPNQNQAHNNEFKKSYLHFSNLIKSKYHKGITIIAIENYKDKADSYILLH